MNPIAVEFGIDGGRTSGSLAGVDDGTSRIGLGSNKAAGRSGGPSGFCSNVICFNVNNLISAPEHTPLAFSVVY